MQEGLRVLAGRVQILDYPEQAGAVEVGQRGLYITPCGRGFFWPWWPLCCSGTRWHVETLDAPAATGTRHGDTAVDVRARGLRHHHTGTGRRQSGLCPCCPFLICRTPKWWSPDRLAVTAGFDSKQRARPDQSSELADCVEKVP